MIHVHYLSLHASHMTLCPADHQMVSVEVSPSTLHAGGVIDIICRQSKPYDNVEFVIEISKEEHHIERFNGSSMTYPVGNASFTVTCVITLYNLKAIPSTFIDNATEAVTVIGMFMCMSTLVLYVNL